MSAMRWMIPLVIPVVMFAQDVAREELKPLPDEKEITRLWPRKLDTKDQKQRRALQLLAMSVPQQRRTIVSDGEVTGPCSIPLTEVHPPDPNAAIVRIPAESQSKMPVMKMPAPPCKP
ncbi:MAG: hypothetical protein JNL98_24470 [Bryobacterales bacterium]|nr:hypothetical protein [Bryobacterales bacterium]